MRYWSKQYAGRGVNQVLIRLIGNFFNGPLFGDKQGVGQDSGLFADNGDTFFPIFIPFELQTDKMFAWRQISYDHRGISMDHAAI